MRANEQSRSTAEEVTQAAEKAREIIQSFEQQLHENPDAAVSIDAEDIIHVNQYLDNNEAPEWAERFYAACETSLQRANEQSR